MTDPHAEIVPVNGFELAVPQRTAKLLYVSDKAPSSVSFGVSITIKVSIADGGVDVSNIPPEDPSTIYTKLPISKPCKPETIPGPDYYPSYAGLNAEQKWIYLNWLRNVTAPINIGYVFIYFYGLERQLLLGNFDLAFDEIIFLQDYHKHSSFLGYSSTALLYAGLLCKRKDKLEQLYRVRPRSSLDNFDLLLAHFRNNELSARNLIDLSNSITGINRTYLQAEPESFELVLTDCLKSKYGGPFFPFASRYEIDSLPKHRKITFANYSFPSQIRTPELPNFLLHTPFVNEVQFLFNETNEKMKLLRKTKRKVRAK